MLLSIFGSCNRAIRSPSSQDISTNTQYIFILYFTKIKNIKICCVLVEISWAEGLRIAQVHVRWCFWDKYNTSGTLTQSPRVWEGFAPYIDTMWPLKSMQWTDFLHNAETKMRLFSISRANLIVLPVKNANELTFGTEHITLPYLFMINIPPFFPSSISTAKCFLLYGILTVLTNW